jgi:hypothetical protein
MKSIQLPFIEKSRKVLVIFALLFSGTLPVSQGMLYAGEPLSVSSAPSSLRSGDSFGGGKVVYLLQPGEQGYTAGQAHGLVAALEDIGKGTTWAKAVKLCQDYRGGGFSDWRLPDKEELNRMYLNKSAIGGFKERHFYWSATESDKNDAWDQSFRNGNSNLGYKLDNNYVRAVRSF